MDIFDEITVNSVKLVPVHFDHCLWNQGLRSGRHLIIAIYRPVYGKWVQIVLIAISRNCDAPLPPQSHKRTLSNPLSYLWNLVWESTETLIQFGIKLPIPCFKAKLRTQCQKPTRKLFNYDWLNLLRPEYSFGCTQKTEGPCKVRIETERNEMHLNETGQNETNRNETNHIEIKRNLMKKRNFEFCF